MALQEITHEEVDSRLLSPSNAGYVFAYDEEEPENFRPPTSITSDLEELIFYPPRNFSNSVPGLSSSSQMLLYVEHLYQVLESHFPEYELNSYMEDFEDYLYQQEVTRAANQRDGLSEEIISQFVRSRTCQDEDLPDICVVCQLEYEREEMLGTLECGHEYHASCIRRWLLEKNSCPVCKRKAIGHHQEEEGAVWF